MRTASDVLTNPVTGDVVIYKAHGDSFQVRINGLFRGRVLAVFDGACQFEYTLSEWRKDMLGAEVLHVAE
jgi:hypothetical protein